MFTAMANKLDQYLEKNPDLAEGFHDRIDVSRQSLHRYRNGERIPEPDSMVKIYVETDGEVDPNSFYALPALRSATKKTAAAR